MTRLIIVTLLLGALLSIAMFEQSYIEKVYNKIKNETSVIAAIIDSTPDGNSVDTAANKAFIDKLYNYWLKKERKLCIFARHFDLMQISDALIYAQNFIHNDNKEEALAGLKRLKYLIETYSHSYGTSIQNIL